MASSIGKSRSHVANTLRLMNLPEQVRTHVLEGRLSAGHARAILTADDPAALAEQIIAKASRCARRSPWLAAPAAPRQKTGGKVVKDTDTQALEVDLSDALGLDVEVLDKGGVGELRINSATLEQLDELCRSLHLVGHRDKILVC